MRAYPVPTPAEWDDVLAATAEYDDVTNPFGTMGQYEMRLARRGIIPTAFGKLIAELQAAADGVGLPRAHLADAITLLDCFGHN
jgi:hypothetical protein